MQLSNQSEIFLIGNPYIHLVPVRCRENPRPRSLFKSFHHFQKGEIPIHCFKWTYTEKFSLLPVSLPSVSTEMISRAYLIKSPEYISGKTRSRRMPRFPQAYDVQRDFRKRDAAETVRQGSPRSAGWRRCCGSKRNTSADPDIPLFHLNSPRHGRR